MRRNGSSMRRKEAKKALGKRKQLSLSAETKGRATRQGKERKTGEKEDEETGKESTRHSHEEEKGQERKRQRDQTEKKEAKMREREKEEAAVTPNLHSLVLISFSSPCSFLSLPVSFLLFFRRKRENLPMRMARDDECMT
ncbi:hypothetical protein CSUI_005326 [Cystoisospora suis]|uniref:Uncharacterized protein n=1 Tax=Cystoisospora suis TaxID=483139 RepID=A0A2C6KY01_9APIC|nr:hypothetical protein CSUI_005326 [Cystoisospora suis]